MITISMTELQASVILFLFCLGSVVIVAFSHEIVHVSQFIVHNETIKEVCIIGAADIGGGSLNESGPLQIGGGWVMGYGSGHDDEGPAYAAMAIATVAIILFMHGLKGRVIQSV